MFYKFPLILTVFTSPTGDERLRRATLIKSGKDPVTPESETQKDKDLNNDFQTLGRIFSYLWSPAKIQSAQPS